jgi:hypothetical protein
MERCGRSASGVRSASASCPVDSSRSREAPSPRARTPPCSSVRARRCGGARGLRPLDAAVRGAAQARPMPAPWPPGNACGRIQRPGQRARRVLPTAAWRKPGQGPCGAVATPARPAPRTITADAAHSRSLDSRNSANRRSGAHSDTRWRVRNGAPPRRSTASRRIVRSEHNGYR